VKTFWTIYYLKLSWGYTPILQLALAHLFSKVKLLPAARTHDAVLPALACVFSRKFSLTFLPGQKYHKQNQGIPLLK
jgi:hypothetical protein